METHSIVSPCALIEGSLFLPNVKINSSVRFLREGSAKVLKCFVSIARVEKKKDIFGVGARFISIKNYDRLGLKAFLVKKSL